MEGQQPQTLSTLEQENATSVVLDTEKNLIESKAESKNVQQTDENSKSNSYQIFMIRLIKELK